MLDRARNDRSDDSPHDLARPFVPLPPWLANRLLRPAESVTHVYGPRFNPSWERYVTHPLLLLLALLIGALAAIPIWIVVEARSDKIVLTFLLLGAVFFPALVFLGIACGYFTRLVVTSQRLVILQGYEICRSWDINRLPRSLLRYGCGGDDPDHLSIDLDAVKRMLGTTSDQIVGATGILALGKQLDQIKSAEKERPY